ncbi:MAG: hypothetical protein ACLTMP_02850 [Eggerthella lenta]
MNVDSATSLPRSSTMAQCATDVLLLREVSALTVRRCGRTARTKFVAQETATLLSP